MEDPFLITHITNFTHFIQDVSQIQHHSWVLVKMDDKKKVQFKEHFSETKIVSFVQTHVINIAGYLNSVLTDRRAFINMLE